MVEMAVADVGTDKVEEFEQGKVVRGWKVTERDRLLIGHLGTVRYLSREQVWRLVFPGRAESVVAERLVALERLKLLRRLRCRRYTGEELEVWALTLGGYRVAEDVTGPLQRIPAHDVGNAFFEHHIGLVELYLRVLGAGVERIGPRRRRAGQPGAARGTRRPNSNTPPAALPSKWKWISGDQLQRLHLSRKLKADEPIQVLVPDAVAEFPFSSAGARRMFLEWETGSNPLAAEEKRNSLVTKLDRYARFLTDYAEALSGPTWYTKAFPDKWPARVRFVMHSERRKKNAVEVLSKWRERQTPRWKELESRDCDGGGGCGGDAFAVWTTPP